jgi:hypothetical protein
MPVSPCQFNGFMIASPARLNARTTTIPAVTIPGEGSDSIDFDQCRSPLKY